MQNFFLRCPHCNCFTLLLNAIFTYFEIVKMIQHNAAYSSVPTYGLGYSLEEYMRLFVSHINRSPMIVGGDHYYPIYYVSPYHSAADLTQLLH